MVEIDRAFTQRALEELVGIDSVNPAFRGADGRPGRGEREIARYAEEILARLGLETRVYEATPGRPSVVGRIAGTGGGRSLMLNGHLDTVGPGGMADPFRPRREGGRLHGRGAYDMKGSLAACLGAVEALARAGRGLRGDVVVALVADEENESLGTREVLRHHTTDGAIVAEPTEQRLCLAHKGFVWVAVTTHGLACHGSDYLRGVDANLRMVRALAPLADLQDELAASEAHPLVGPESLHLARLEGGEGPSIYADRCRAQIELRTIPGSGGARPLDRIRSLAEAARARMREHPVEVEEVLTRPPFEAIPASPLAAAVQAAAAAVRGCEPPVVGVPFWTDAAFVREQGADTVVYGPAGAGAHADEEWVELESVFDCAEVFLRVALGYCDGPNDAAPGSDAASGRGPATSTKRGGPS